MPACALTQSYNLDCRDSYGGVYTVYVMEFDNALAITAAAGIVTGITKATTKLFRRYKLIAHTGDGNESAKMSRDAGTIEVEQSLKFPINKMTVAIRNELMLLAKNRLLFVVVDENEITKGWLYGKDYGLMGETFEAKTGVQLADRNGYELTFMGKEKELAMQVDAATMLTLETAGV